MSGSPIAFIGSRDFNKLPADLRALFLAAARWVATSSRTVYTGAAGGTDQEAAAAALDAGGTVHLFRPDQTSHEKWCQEQRRTHLNRIRWTIYDEQLHTAWTESVDRHHPNPAALRPYVRRLMARNYGIIMGDSMHPRVGAVVALPRSAAEWGGTGQGMRIAEAAGIPVYNLWEGEARERLERRVGG